MGQRKVIGTISECWCNSLCVGGSAEESKEVCREERELIREVTNSKKKLDVMRPD